MNAQTLTRIIVCVLLATVAQVSQATNGYFLFGYGAKSNGGGGGGELGTVARFANEGSLAVYMGMATLDNSSGKHRGSKNPKHVNTRAKAAMMVGIDRHRKQVPESQRYYEKKRAQGKTHNQAIRALGRPLVVLFFRC